jgi:hypothetical protein
MRWAYVFGLAVAFLLPKQVECGFPGGRCETRSSLGLVCHRYEVEPLGFYALEKVAGHDVGFAYSHDETCR